MAGHIEAETGIDPRSWLSPTDKDTRANIETRERDVDTPKITSREIIEAHHRIGDIMDRGADPEATSDELEGLDAEADALFEELGEATPQKLEALRAVCLHLEAEEKMIRAEERRLATRRRSRERAILRVRSYAAGILSSRRAAGMDPRIKTAEHTFYLQRSRSFISPKHVSPWIEQGWVTRDPKPDKVAARAAVEAGIEVEGFGFEESEGIRWK